MRPLVHSYDCIKLLQDGWSDWFEILLGVVSVNI